MNWDTSRPERASRSIVSRAALPFPSAIASAAAKISSESATPSTARTSSVSTGLPPYATSWSSVPRASRKLPPAAREIAPTAPSSISIPSATDTRSRTSAIWRAAGRWKSNRWQRSTIVGITLCASVVASTNTVLGGGSSRVFRNAFQASLVSMWASSMM